MGGTANADAELHPNLCAYVRACLGTALEDDFEPLEGIIGVDSCDAMRRLFDVWCSGLSPGFSHILALPHLRTKDAMRFYRSELEWLVQSLNQHFSLEISDDDLHSGIELINETRSLLQKLDQVHRRSFSISGRRFVEIVRDAMTQPKSDFNPWLRSLLDTTRASGTENADKVNIVLAGGVLDDPWFLDIIEEAGGSVVADDMCCGSRYYRELTSVDEEPLVAIAKRYVFRSPCARMFTTEARIDRLTELYEETEARGVIYYTVKFCDPHALDWVSIGRALQSKGIPVLQCETDYSVGGRERMKIRIEAFLEILRY